MPMLHYQNYCWNVRNNPIPLFYLAMFHRKVTEINFCCFIYSFQVLFCASPISTSFSTFLAPYMGIYKDKYSTHYCMKTWLKSYQKKMDKIYYKKTDYENFVNYIVFYAVMIVLDANKSNKVSVGKTSLYFISGISWPWRCVPIYISRLVRARHKMVCCYPTDLPIQ